MAKKELHSLLDEKGIEGKPLLILNNKIDIEPHMSESDIIKELNLDYASPILDVSLKNLRVL